MERLLTTARRYLGAARRAQPLKVQGRVTQVLGLVIEGLGPASSVGGACVILPQHGAAGVPAEVVGFRDQRILLMPLGELRGIGPGSTILSRNSVATTPVGPKLLGRVLNGLGEPIDGRGPLEAETAYPLYAEPLNPMTRRRLREPLDVGVKAINGLLTIGKGQRLALMAGSGVGKSVLLGMIARFTTADVNVIALVGERGRELREFLENDLGAAGLRRSVVVCATSDQPPLIRMRAAYVATAVAEYFRGCGRDVLLLMDSLTRFAMAQREVGLAIGEPPTSRGYTPSVFALLPKLLERAGNAAEAGSITGIYTVLVEGDDMDEPIADAVRSILDGHVELSRELAARNHFPAINVLRSLSRPMKDVVPPEHLEWAGRLRRIAATYAEAEDLINIGAYVRGSNVRIDDAIDRIGAVNDFLQQRVEVGASMQATVEQLRGVVA
ncbi:MAG: FliI/YscN family ATPase [Candidatus Tectomicrobia bacterium]|nr:FliI/YscN family ATPase [Candidatus Tectomicrobia bacterium]